MPHDEASYIFVVEADRSHHEIIKPASFSWMAMTRRTGAIEVRLNSACFLSWTNS